MDQKRNFLQRRAAARSGAQRRAATRNGSTHAWCIPWRGKSGRWCGTWSWGVGLLKVVARSCYLCAFPFALFSWPKQIINSSFQQECKAKSILNKSSQTGLGGVPSHKRARLNNNFKSDHLTLEQKVWVIQEGETHENSMMSGISCSSLKVIHLIFRPYMLGCCNKFFLILQILHLNSVNSVT